MKPIQEQGRTKTKRNHLNLSQISIIFEIRLSIGHFDIGEEDLAGLCEVSVHKIIYEPWNDPAGLTVFALMISLDGTPPWLMHLMKTITTQSVYRVQYFEDLF